MKALNDIANTLYRSLDINHRYQEQDLKRIKRALRSAFDFGRKRKKK